MHPGTTMSKGVGRLLHSAWQLTAQGCEAGTLLSTLHQGKRTLWKRTDRLAQLQSAGPAHSFLPGQGCGSDSNLTRCLIDEQVVGWGLHDALESGDKVHRSLHTSWIRLIPRG